jgi:hypothetical protein
LIVKMFVPVWKNIFILAALAKQID